MKVTSFIIGLLSVSHQATAIVDQWTPAGFDWDSHVGMRSPYTSILKGKASLTLSHSTI